MPESEILSECKRRFHEQEKDMESFRRSMFGENGLGGVCGRLKNKVSKKTLVAIAVILSGFIVAGLTAWGGVKEKIFDNKQSIAMIQAELNHIKKTTDKIEKNLMDPKDLLRAIRNIIKDATISDGE